MKFLVRRMLLVCLAAMLFLCTGCKAKPVVFPPIPSGGGSGGADDDEIIEYENVDYVYELFRLPVDADDIYIDVHMHDRGRAAVYDDQIFLYTIDGPIGEWIETLYMLDASGTIAAEYPVRSREGGVILRSMTQAYDAASKQVIGVGYTESQNALLFYCAAEDGAMLRSSEPVVYEHSPYGYFSAVDASLFYFSNVNDGNKLYFITPELEVTGPFTQPSTVETAFRHDDGRVIAVCENGECMRYDEETGKLTDIRLYEATEAWSKASQILYGEDGGVYFVNSDGITVQRNGEDVLLCDFNKSYLSLDALQFVDVLSGDRFLVWYSNPLTGEDYPAIFAPTDDTARPVRKLVRVASVGTNARISNEIFRSEMIYASVAHFNMTNDEYFIELTDFDSIAEIDQHGNRIPGDTSSIRDRLFEEALLSGEQYDVYLIGESYKDRDMLVEKGLFEDLTDFAEHKHLIACVRDAMPRDGQITGIPFSVELSTLVTSTDILPAGTPFTYDKLMEIYENLENGESLFCDYTGREMRQSAMYDFIDFDSKTCSFDSAEFAEVFGFLSDYEAAAFDGGALTYTPTGYMNRAVGSFSGHPQGVTAYGDIIDAFAKGDIKFLQLPIGAPDTLSSMLYFFDMLGKDYNLCGYPSAAGGTITVSTPMLMSVGAECENRTGAYRYLSLLLSDLLQTQDAMYAFPVTESAVQTRLSWGYQYYYLSEETGTYTTRNYGSALRIQFAAASGSPLTSMQASYYDASLQLLKPQVTPLLDYVCNSSMRGAGDTMIRSIIEEELSYVSQGVRSAEEAGKIIQSRVFIYINE